MLVIKQINNQYQLVGVPQEFKELLRAITHCPDASVFNQHITKFNNFYFAIFSASKKSETKTKYILCSENEMDWIHKIKNAFQENDKVVPRVTQEILRRYEESKTIEGIDPFVFDYQAYLEVDCYEMLLSFMGSFELNPLQLEELVVGTYLEQNETMRESDIKGDMWDDVYTAYFSMFADLLFEMSFLYTYQEFVNKLKEEFQGVDIKPSEWLWLYMYYLEINLKMLNEEILYEAENKEIAFSWCKPYILEFVAEMTEDKNELLKVKALFRKIYIEELSTLFTDLEKVESDREEPFNVVFYLSENKRVVSNTVKHFDQYLYEVRNNRLKVTEEGIQDFVQTISPIQGDSSLPDIDQLSWREVIGNIYPLIRPNESLPSEAIRIPFAEGLSISFGIEKEEGGKYQLAFIMNKMANKWAVSQEELYGIAVANLKQRPLDWTSYYKKVEAQLPKEQVVLINRPFRETVMPDTRNPLNSSHILDKDLMNEYKDKWGSVIVSVPSRDSIFVTKKEHLSFITHATKKLYEAHPARISKDVFEWDGELLKKIT